MFAPEAAKAMPKCGSGCIQDIGGLTKLMMLRAQKTQIQAVNRLGEAEGLFSTPSQIGKSKFNQITFNTISTFCKLFSSISASSLKSQAITLPNCLMNKQEMADLVRGFSDSVMHNASGRTASIIQLPDGRKFHGISGDKHDFLELDPDIKSLYGDILECLNVKQ